MRVTLNYTVPVSVVVDTETGDVARVTVHDELVEQSGFASDPRSLTPEQVDEAFALAEDAEWPAWTFG